MRCGSASATEARRPLAAAALLLVAACAPQPPAPAPTAEPAAAPAPAPKQAVMPAEPAVHAPVTAAPTPEQPPRRITIAAVGDMMIGTDYPRDHLPDDDGAGFFAAVAPLLRSADLTVGNLEGVLADGGEPAKQCRNLNACYLFRSPTRYAQHYRDAGFDALSLANNHARDFGEAGRTATMAALDAVGIQHSGREGEFASFETAGLRIAWLAFAVTRDSNLLHDYELANHTVSRFAQDHDIVIVSFHGGAEGVAAMHLPFAEEEYFGEPRGDVVRFARGVVDAGADLVIGHGPHVVRALENYNGRLITYSLGNFATYYGISVSGLKGVAPILLLTLDGEGRFLEGRIVSTEQIRPAGPTLDEKQRALHLIRNLTESDFEDPGLRFTADGQLLLPGDAAASRR